MANVNTAALVPEFWMNAFDELDKGNYNLQNSISRNTQSQLANFGDTVNVPLTPELTQASDYTPGDAIVTENVTQQLEAVILDKSKAKAITLTGSELSMNPYELISVYGVPMAESILQQVNEDITSLALH